MGYRRLTPSEEMGLRPYLDKIESLDEGKAVSLSFRNEYQASQVRLLLYSHFYYAGIKSLFTLKRLSPDTIEVRRKYGFTAQLREESSPAEEFVKQCMLEIDDENSAEDCIRQGVADGKLSTSEALDALEEWRRIQG